MPDKLTASRTDYEIESACVMNISPPGPPMQAPKIHGVSFTANSFTVEWNCSADNFTFNITPNDLDCTRNSLTTATCRYSKTHQDEIYTYTVAAFNCGNLRGNESTGRVELEGMSLTINTCYFYQCTEKARYLFSYDIRGKKAIEKLVGMLHLRTVRTNLPHV